MNYYKKYLKYKLKYLTLNGGVGLLSKVIPTVSKEGNESKYDLGILGLIKDYTYQCEFIADNNLENLESILDKLKSSLSCETVTFNYNPTLNLFLNKEHLDKLLEDIKQKLKLKKIKTLILDIIFVDDSNIVQLDNTIFPHLETLIFNPNRLSRQLILSGEFIKLTRLKFGDEFNTELVGLEKLVNLTHLELGKRFNKKLDLSKCVNLTKLFVGDRFNNGVVLTPEQSNNVSASLSEADHNNSFDISNLTNLKSLYLGNHFNTKLVGLEKLKKLIKLKLGDEHNISTSSRFNQTLNLSNCQELTELTLGAHFNHKLDLSKCVKLIKVILGEEFNNGVERTLVGDHNIPLWSGEELDDNNFDISKLTNLESLNFKNSVFNTKLFGLENLKKLTELKLSERFNHKLDLSQCVSLTILKFGNNFNNGVKVTNDRGNMKVNEELDDNKFDISKLTKLKELYLGNNFNVKLVGFEKLTELTRLKYGALFNVNTQQLDLSTFSATSEFYLFERNLL